MPDLLVTKLHRPSIPVTWIQRPDLVKRLNEGLDLHRQVTLVSAPAGYGKTTCISEWLNSLDGWTSSWLSLDISDDDPGRFFNYLIAALQQVDAQLVDGIAGSIAAGQLPPVEVISAALINDLCAYPGHILLVLDDFHVIQDSLILQTIEQMIANHPESLHLMLITREDPPLPLARLRANI